MSAKAQWPTIGNAMKLEDAVHNVRTHSSTGTEDCYYQLEWSQRAQSRYSKHTCIAQFLSKLLAAFLKLVLLRVLRIRGVRRARGGSALADLEGHISIVCWRRRMNRIGLCCFFSHVAGRENALSPSILVAASPPCSSLVSSVFTSDKSIRSYNHYSVPG